MAAFAKVWQTIKRSWVLAAAVTLMSIVLPALVSAGVAGYIQWHSQSSLAEAVRVIETGRQFDESHNAVITQLGMFTDDLQNNRPIEKSNILGAIIAAQSKLIALQSRLPESDYALIGEYGDELNNLHDALEPVEKPTDLGQVYKSVQRLLVKHDEIDHRIDKKAAVTFF